MKKKGTIVAGLMMAVVLTGYSVAGTYAKYIETAKDSDSATVAKWNVIVSAGSQTRLFNTASNNATKNNRVAPGGSDTATWTVAAANNGSEVEVSTIVSLTIENSVQKEISKEQYDMLYNAGLTDVIRTEGTKYYYAPVVFTTTKVADKDGEITNPSSSKANYFAADSSLTTTSGDKYEISWKWAYEAKELVAGVSTDVANLVDALDTQLGKEANTDTTRKIQVVATATAIQGKVEQPAAYTASIATTADATDIASFVADWGYDASKTVGVTFADGKLTGTINKNTNATLLSKYPSTDPVGYYYPITVTGTPGAVFTISGKTTKTLSIDYDGHTTVLMALDQFAVDKTIKVVIDGTTTEIDYSGLTFAE